MPSKILRLEVYRRALMIFSAALAVFPLTGFAQRQVPPGAPAYREDRIIIQGKRGHDAALASRHAAEKVRVHRAYPHLNNMQVIQLPKGTDVRAVLERYRRSGDVDVAEPDYYLYPAVTPNDPGFIGGALCGLPTFFTPNEAISAPLGWDTLSSASNVIVAVVDSGVWYTHEDLAANIWTGPGGIHGVNATNGTINAFSPLDDYGHGTMVAGVLGAVGNNGTGVVGVAWRVQLMAGKFIDGAGNGSLSGAIACFDYAQTHGAKIINASFVAATYLASLYTAVAACRSAGIIVVCAAGNFAWNNDDPNHYVSPANFPLDNVVSVAATDQGDSFAFGYSCYGPTTVDLAAPGTLICSTANGGDNFYNYDTGTSFSAPYVSGALALMIARYYPTNYNSTNNYRQIIDRLMVSVDVLPSLAGKCVTGGRLNLNKALNHFPPTLTATRGASFGQLSLKLKGEPAQKYIVQASPDFAVWTPISTNTTSSAATFTYNTNTATNQYKLFRAVLVP